MAKAKKLTIEISEAALKRALATQVTYAMEEGDVDEIYAMAEDAVRGATAAYLASKDGKAFVADLVKKDLESATIPLALEHVDFNAIIAKELKGCR